MKKFAMGIVIAITLASCGGGGGNASHDVILAFPLPQALQDMSPQLTLTGKVKGGEGDGYSVISSIEGASGDLGYTFSFVDLPSFDANGSMIEIEFGAPVSIDDLKSEGETTVIVARLSVPYDPTQNPYIINASDSDYVFDLDDDGDGLNNLSEFSISSNPLLPDTDGDATGDATDNCPLVHNADQSDDDADGVGNACDDDFAPATDVDSDGDGLVDSSDNCPSISNPDQSDIDGDKKGDACDGDIDGDGVANASDDCPQTKNADQSNVDGDANGDACDGDIDGDGIPNDSDNCPYAANPAQAATDEDNDGVPVDCDLDESDPRVGSAQDAVFVDGARGDDGDFGTMAHPLATISAAIVKARSAKKDVYAAAGEYVSDGIKFYSGINLFGGFRNSGVPAERFSFRDVRSNDPSYKTVLKRDDSDVTLRLEGVETVIGGFHIANGASEADPMFGARTVVVGNGADVTLDRNTIDGNSTVTNSIAVVTEHGGNSVLSHNLISGGGRDVPGSSSVGVFIDDASAMMINNIIKGGAARFSTGLAVKESSPLIVNNTIDASSGFAGLGGADGVRLEYANPILVNNLVLTSKASSQYALSCFGTMNSSAKILNNLFANFPGDEGHVLVHTCDGINLTSDDFTPNFAMGDANVTNNLAYSASNDMASLVDIANFYQLKGFGGADGVNDGMNSNASEFGFVVDDFLGDARTAPYDIGAREK